MAKNKIKPRAMIGDVPVWCVHDEIVNCAELKPNPKNPNTHPGGQIKLLGKIILEQGWRMPITVSKRSGLIVKGHGRLEAAFRVGILKAPVDLQDYESEAAEHADMVADNRLAELAELDAGSLERLMAELSDFDVDMELTGFDGDDLDRLLGGGLNNEDIPDDQYKEQYGVIVICESEVDQETIFNDLIGRGYNCRVVVT